VPKAFYNRVYLSVSKSVSESTVHTENFVNTISKKTIEGKFHPILVRDVFVFVDVLIRFRVKRYLMTV